MFLNVEVSNHCTFLLQSSSQILWICLVATLFTEMILFLSTNFLADYSPCCHDWISGKKRLILAHSSRMKFLILEKSWQPEPEEADYIRFSVRKHREMNIFVLFIYLFIFKPEPQSTVLFIFRVGLPTPVQPRTPSPSLRDSQRFVFYIILYPVKWTIFTTIPFFCRVW